MSDLPWLKLYTEALHDPKFVVAATDNQMDEMTVFGIWMALLCIAARSPKRGYLTASNNRNYTIEQLDAIVGWKGNMGTGDLASLFESFIDLDMIAIDEQGAYYIINFETRQETKDERAARMNRERQKRFRDSHKEDEVVTETVTNNADITPSSISISISNSLIKEDSLTKNPIFSTRDAEKALIQVTKWTFINSEWMEAVDAILSYMQRHGWDKTIADMEAYKNDWVSHVAKNGKNYSVLNKTWIFNMIADVPIGAPHQSTPEEDQAMIVQAFIKAGQK